MSTGAIIAIIVVILIVAALLVGLSVVNRRRRLRDRFGPEYDRAVNEHGRREGEAELDHARGLVLGHGETGEG